MNKIAAFFLVLIIASCQEDDSKGLNPEDNFVRAKRNNIDWIGTAEIELDEVTDTLTFFGIVNLPNGEEIQEIIVMKMKFDGEGSYSLIKDQAYYYTIFQGDIGTRPYKLAPNAVGEFVILKYEPIEKLIEGSFEISLKKENSNPDIYNFAQGTFKGQISD